ncbi:MAG: anthranilate phosphoribosyltransferase [Brumimicrobium sp.]|nr:anthranilate phosphoribosyltransferase [Brumimicrobium sp.]
MQTTLTQLIEHRSLSTQKASEVIHGIYEGKFSEPEIVGLMVSLQTRSLTLEEIRGFREALLALAIKPEINGTHAIDLCGTGGDGKNTFNISTTTAFVLASLGYQVIKHGNYGVSSLCGSSNVLEQLGVRFSDSSEILNKQLEKFGICFLHAPLFHPVMKKVAPIRKALGIPTFFNIMGPLVNPVQPAYQLSGTFSLELARIYHHLLAPGRKNYAVLYSLDGYDEISLTGDTRIFSKTGDQVLSASSLGAEKVHHTAIHGGNSVDEAAEIMRNILQGKGTPAQNKVIAANTAQAIITMEPAVKLKSAFEHVLSHLESGAAYPHFRSFIHFQKTPSCIS